MSGQHELTPERKKALRNGHPLYSRLSGDVVWGLYEELGLDAQACGTGMDAFIENMHATVAAMDRLERDPRAFLAIRVEGAACTACAALHGTALRASDPAWARCLPPFAVGCRARCQALDEEAVRAGGYTVVKAATLERPACPLLCACAAPGE